MSWWVCGQKATLWSWFSPVTLTWVLGIEVTHVLRLSLPTETSFFYLTYSVVIILLGVIVIKKYIYVWKLFKHLCTINFSRFCVNKKQEKKTNEIAMKSLSLEQLVRDVHSSCKYRSALICLPLLVKTDTNFLNQVSLCMFRLFSVCLLRETRLQKLSQQAQSVSFACYRYTCGDIWTFPAVLLHVDAWTVFRPLLSMHWFNN